MKNKTLLVFILASLVIQYKAFSQTIATFEVNNSDLFDSFTWTAGDGSFGVVDNPSQTGINTSKKCLLNHRVKSSSSAWTASGDFCSSNQKPLLVAGDKHYLHVFVYSDQSYAGIIRLRYTAADNKWLSPAIESRFSFTAGTWTDVVLDLKTAGADSIYGFYFMSQDWSGTSYTNDSYFYYDEIAVTNNATPRTSPIEDAVFTTTKDSVIANFEDGHTDLLDSLTWTESDGSFGIVDNPSKTGLNTTSKCLLNHRVKTSSSAWTVSGDLCNRLQKPIVVSGNNHYLHALVYSDQSYAGIIRLRYTSANNKWLSPAIESRFTFKAGEWTDVVLDLQTAGADSIYGFYFMSQDWSGSSYANDSYFYYDELEVTSSAAARTVPVYNPTIATFEDNNTDRFDSLTWTAADGSFSIVNNPSKTGINKTGKCLLNHRVKGTSSAWTVSGDLCNKDQKPFIVDKDHQYLHVFVYSDQSYPGIIRLRYTAADNKWLSPAKESRFTFVAGKWTDVVLDLKSIAVDSIYGLYLMSQDWSGSSFANDSYFYYDEMEVTNSADARGVSLYDSACTVADFEKNGVIPAYTMYGSNGGTTLSLVENTDIKGLNSSATALKASQTGESVWWSRANLVFESPVQVTDQTRYLHFYVKSPRSTLSVLTYEPSEHWFPNVAIPIRNAWCDVVVDLMSSAFSLKGTTLTSFGICANSSTYIPSMDWYVDQVVFNADSNQRTGEASDLDSLNCELTTNDDDWTFVGQAPGSKLKVTNQSAKSTKFVLQIDVRTDAKQAFDCLNDTLTLAPHDSAIVNHTLSSAVPGIYRYYINVLNDQYVRNKIIRQIAYNPEKMISAPDSLAGYTAFWNAAKAELATVAPEYTVTYKETIGTHKIYDVSMKSIKGNTIKGYFSVPDKTGKFPVIVHSNGYGVTASEPDRSDDYAVFSYNIRGMGISTDYSATDEVFVNGLKDINTYYYRECFMDALRAVDFVCSRPEVDATKVFAEGESQGGALTFVIAALDKRIVAAAAMVPFLSDFPDYYTIKESVTEIPEWPMNYLNQYMDQYNISKDSIFKNLTYFDIKNLAGKINCPLLMAVGMQDETCPPHTNFAAYNQVKTKKEYKVYRSDGHYVNRSFLTYKDAWFNTILDSLKTNLPEVASDNLSSRIQIYTKGNVINVYSSAQKPVTMSVYSVSGSLVNRSVLNESATIPANPGLYIVELTSGQDKLTRKVILY